MKTRILSYLIVAIAAIIGATGCSKNEIDPEDYYVSYISGTFEKNGNRVLEVIVNGEQIENYGSVILDAKMTRCNLTFVNVIPGVEEKEFKNVPLTDTEDYLYFAIDGEISGKPIAISGKVRYLDALMTIDITM